MRAKLLVFSPFENDSETFDSNLKERLDSIISYNVKLNKAAVGEFSMILPQPVDVCTWRRCSPTKYTATTRRSFRSTCPSSRRSILRRGSSARRRDMSATTKADSSRRKSAAVRIRWCSSTSSRKPTAMS